MIAKNFKNAYNNFDIRKLSGGFLANFYVEEFTKKSVERIIATINVSKYSWKMLVIGHKGCGKSTIINKVAEEIKNDYHIVVFEANEVLNLMDVETIDILVAIYMQILKSMQRQQIKVSMNLFRKIMDFVKEDVDWNETADKLLDKLSIKLKAEDKTRGKVREKLRTQIRILQENIAGACKDIQKASNKEVIVIIDELDKLDRELAQKIFIQDSTLITMQEVKIIFTFPLESYYSESYLTVKEQYRSQLIPLVNLYNIEKQYQQQSLLDLRDLVFKRIDAALVEDDALKYLIDNSGGLLRHLMKFMQDACLTCIIDNSHKIDKKIAEQTVAGFVNDYVRLYDHYQYGEQVSRFVAKVQKTKYFLTREELDNKTLISLLSILFLLEYRHENDLWYDLHPCFKKSLDREL